MKSNRKSKLKSIGLVGIGLLGSAIAERLLAAGFRVLGHDILSERTAALEALGGQACAAPHLIFLECDSVILCLPNSDVCCDLIQAQSPAIRPGTTIMDTTTGDPQKMMALGKLLLRQHVDYVEANVAGSSEQLRGGQAILILGGDTNAVRRQGSMLEALAARRFYVGPVGAASRLKLVHNTVLGLHRAVLAEGLSFAIALGLDPATTLSILIQSPAASSVMETKGLKMIEREFEPQARLSQHLKDVRLILAEAKRVGATMPLSEIHQVLLEKAEELGFGEADNSAIIKAFRARITEAEE